MFLIKLLSYFLVLFYCCFGDRVVYVLGIARIMFLVIIRVYLRCLANLHSCGVLARCPFTCKQGVILRLFLSCPRDRVFTCPLVSLMVICFDLGCLPLILEKDC